MDATRRSVRARRCLVLVFILLVTVAVGGIEIAAAAGGRPAGGCAAPRIGEHGPATSFPAFVPMPGVTPEGVAVDRLGNVYVTVREGDRGAIVKYDRDGQPSRFADIGTGTIGGLAMAPNGDLYVAMAVGPDRGVYRVDRHRRVERLPGTEQIVFANALAFDRRGVLYVTESYSMDSPPSYGPGGIWRIGPGRHARLWLRDPLLTGIGAVLGYPVGANGIASYDGDLYVANTDKGLVVRVGIEPDGRPSEPEVWKRLEDVPGTPAYGSAFPVMADGLIVDRCGNLYVAIVSRNAIVRLDADDRAQRTIAAFVFAPTPEVPIIARADTPASLAFGAGPAGRHQLFVTNLGMMSAIIPGPPWPGPGLVYLEDIQPDR